MDDLSGPGGLLEQASNVFTLAQQLAETFEGKPDRSDVERPEGEPQNWSLHRPAFAELCDAVLAMRDVMETPPSSSRAIAAALREVAGVAKDIRDVMATSDGQLCSSYLAERLRLRSAATQGQGAVIDARKAHAPPDPFAFLNAPAPNALEIDTTPAMPKPPQSLVDAAERDIPTVMANLPPPTSGVAKPVACILSMRLRDAGRTWAAAE